jgi:hypothetical protein
MEQELIELKAKAYDLIAVKEQAQTELNNINNRIIVLMQEIEKQKNDRL